MPKLIIDDMTFLTKAELAQRWRVKTRTIENWVRENKCPQPVKVHDHMNLFRFDDVLAQEAAWQKQCDPC